LRADGWLLHGLADFDFICESLLPSQHREVGGAVFAVGEMRYETVIVPGMRTIRSTTLARLEAFVDRGGSLVFLGEIPTLVDAVASAAPARLAARCRCAPLSAGAVLDAVEACRDIRLVDARGVAAPGVLHQMREEDGHRYLFLCNTHLTRTLPGLTLQVRGAWQPTLLDTMKGSARILGARRENGWTLIACRLEAHGSMLLDLAPSAGAETPPERIVDWIETARLADPVPVSLSEPNVLLLDYAEMQINDGEWTRRLPILELDPLIERALELPARGGRMAQPWTDARPLETLATVRVRMRFTSRVAVQKPGLALESLAQTRVFLDGREQDRDATGYFVDESIVDDRPGAVRSGRT
jgi:hypothetical protein